MSSIQPGQYTIRWIADSRVAPSLQPLRVAQIAAFALQPRYGTLQGNAPQPTDAEVIRHRVGDDAITGVVRVSLPNATTTDVLGDAILAALRSNGVPDATAHTSIPVVPQLVPFAPILAPLAGLGALAARISPTVRESYSRRVGSVIVEITPGIDNTARPLAASNPVSGVLAAASTRESADPARAGNIGASAATDAARAAAAASQLSTGTIVAIVAGATVLTALAVAFVVHKVA